MGSIVSPWVEVGGYDRLGMLHELEGIKQGIGGAFGVGLTSERTIT